MGNDDVDAIRREDEKDHSGEILCKNYGAAEGTVSYTLGCILCKPVNKECERSGLFF